MSPASDEDLLARQSALQDEAQEVLAGLDLAALAARCWSLAALSLGLCAGVSWM
jgi:hypothetical protein